MLRVLSRLCRRGFSTEAKGEVTALYDFHVENGGKMVNFGGFMLPVQYSDLGIAASHLHTRRSASLFDVSHMLQTEVTGPDSIPFLESLCTADLRTLPVAASTLTVFTGPDGGVLDDLIVTKIAADHLFVVSNAAMRDQDRRLLLAAARRLRPAASLRFFEPAERALVAVQGPLAAAALQPLTDARLAALRFMTSTEAAVCGAGACRLTRCGYTGEDGFEISMPAIKAADVCRELLRTTEIKLAGLGARDSLRLEAGLCLYGSDITASTTPVEAALTWLVAKRRRQTRDFPGAEVILRQIAEGVARKRAGLVSEAGPPARQGSAVVDAEGREVGVVTSGCPAPSLGKNVAMAYLPAELCKVGTRLQLRIRGRLYEAAVAKMPFVPARYYTKTNE